MHELTEKIANYQHANPGRTFTEYDSIIREWLEKAEFNLSRYARIDAGVYTSFREILGLSEQNLDKSEPQKEVWCEHMDPFEESKFYFGFANQEFHFCPICGTPRPKTPSLVEELTKTLKDTFETDDKDWIDVAETAISFLKSEWEIK